MCDLACMHIANAHTKCSTNLSQKLILDAKLVMD